MTYDPRRCMTCAHGLDHHDDVTGCILVSCDCRRFVTIATGSTISGSGDTQ